MAVFQVNLGYVVSTLALFLQLFRKRTFGAEQDFLWAVCPSSYPTNSVEALKETQSTEPNQYHGLILSSTGLLTERVLLPVCQLFTANTKSAFQLQYRLMTNVSLKRVSVIVVVLCGDLMRLTD